MKPGRVLMAALALVLLAAPGGCDRGASAADTSADAHRRMFDAMRQDDMDAVPGCVGKKTARFLKAALAGKEWTFATAVIQGDTADVNISWSEEGRGQQMTLMAVRQGGGWVADPFGETPDRELDGMIEMARRKAAADE